MSETDKNKGAKKDLKDDLKEGAKKLKDKAKEIVRDIDENTQEFQEEAKSTASDFTEGAKDAYEQITSDHGSKRIVAGIVAILFGALGIHKFILGYQKEGLIMFIVSLLSFGILAALVALVGIIEGIIYLSKSDEDFFQTYQIGSKPWF
jgi:TM2 domain-containing membrane protein YozV